MQSCVIYWCMDFVDSKKIYSTIFNSDSLWVFSLVSVSILAHAYCLLEGVILKYARVPKVGIATNYETQFNAYYTMLQPKLASYCTRTYNFLLYKS